MFIRIFILLVISICILLTQSVFAQRKPGFGISFSPFYAGQIYVPGDKQHFVPMDSDISRNSKLGFSGGLSYSFPISKSIDLESFITYSQSRFSWGEDSESTTLKGRHSQIELFLSPKFYINKFLYFRLGIGPSFLLSEKNKYIDLDEPNPFDAENVTIRYISNYSDDPYLPAYAMKRNYLNIDDNLSNSLSHVHRINIVSGLGFGAEVKLNKSLMVALEPYIKAYCRPHYKDKFYEQYVYLTETKEQKNYNIRLYNWNLGLTTKLVF